MRAPTLRLVTDRFPNDYEIEVDNFAGGGGASLGLELALGRSPAVAINHDPEALAMHRANHPDCEHYCEDVFDVDPLAVCRGRKVGLAWFSPDCKHHSKAKGGPPIRSKKIRGLAWVVLDWARIVRPRIICLENVEEFIKWGPLDKKGRIIKRRAGEEFAEWWDRFERLGYKGEFKILRACDYGAPTSRKRLFVIFRCDGEPIVWPEPTHGPGRANAYRTAAECIDFSLPCPSIFLTPEEAKLANVRRPLADKTLRRIARGMKKYVFGAKRPFIVPVSHGDKGKTDERCHDIDEPARTITGANRGELALVQPFVSSFYGESRDGEVRGRGVDHPLPTQTTANRFAVIAPYIAGVGGRQGLSIERSVDRPYQTITTKADSVVVAPVLVRTAHGEVDKRGKRRGKGSHEVDEPLPTICASSVDYAIAAATMIQTGYGERPGQAPRCLDIEAPIGTIISGGSGGNGKHALVTAFFAKHFGDRATGGWAGGATAEAPFGTVTTQDHHALVTSNIVKLRGTSEAHMDASSIGTDAPIPTISAGGWHLGEVRAFLTKYNGVGENVEDLRDPLDTVTTRDRFNLVTVDGSDYQVVDIGMRMLTPRELFRAQGFPDRYIIDPVYERTWVTRKGKRKSRIAPLSGKAQVKMCGNSVAPDVARAIVAANYVPQRVEIAAPMELVA